MRRILVSLFLLVLTVTLARADSVTLKSGQTFTGEIISETLTQVAIKTPGGIMTFPRAAVASIKSDAVARAEFQQRYAGVVAKLITGHLELAKWCLEQGLVPEAQRHYQRVLEYDAANVQARAGLQEVAARGRTQPVVDIELELVDKSTVKGKTDKTLLTISTDYGELRIPLANVVSASFSSKRGEDKIVTRDFPVTGDITDNQLRVTTGMGELTLNLENVTRLVTRHKLSPVFVANTLDAETANLHQMGLDVMIVYDDTDSMESTLVALKQNFARMVRCVQARVPQVRIGFVAYRDSKQFTLDEFTFETKLVSPLTRETDKAYEAFLNEGVAGGGDIPEAVFEGLQTAMEKAGWNPDARKVIVLLGDAPPHAQNDGLNRLYKAVEDWSTSAKGFVHTIDTTGYGKHMPEFKEIARRGGGVSYALPKEELVAQYVAVSILGPRWADQVSKAYRDTPEAEPAPAPAENN